MILAAGLGSRLKPITDNLPKPLIDVGGISLIERSINQLVSFGVSELIINVSHLGDQIKESLQSIDAISKITFIEEPFPYGTGGALVNAKSFLGNDPFILSTADIIFDLSFYQLPKTIEAAHLVAVKNPEHNQRGDFSMNVSSVFINDGKNDFTYSGMSVLNPNILDGHLSRKYPFDLWNTILKPLIAESRVSAHFDDSLWIDVGTEDRL
ncbi:MAG: nucleotidyltransferase family protein, partial [Gammaproteobacteria bacterium]